MCEESYDRKVISALLDEAVTSSGSYFLCLFMIDLLLKDEVLTLDTIEGKFYSLFNSSVIDDPKLYSAVLLAKTAFDKIVSEKRNKV